MHASAIDAMNGLEMSTEPGAIQSPVFDRINQLPRARQQFVMEVIESALAQSSR